MAPKKRNGGVAAIMSHAEILEHFGTARVQTLPTCRALCNALKALVIAAAVRALREVRRNRIIVCDVGCGKGGDVGKWMPHRPKKLIGVDGSKVCISEAQTRHNSMVTTGRGSMVAIFLAQDLCSRDVALPAEDGSVDIVCSHFFLQFAASDGAVLGALVADSYRCLAPGGVFVCLVPDGDRIFSLLAVGGDSERFGHFLFRKCSGMSYDVEGSAFGIAYAFSLGQDECTEYILFPALLERVLRDVGFVPVLPNGKLSSDAQEFFHEHLEDGAVVADVTRGQSCSHTDWLTLGLFRVFMCRKAPPPTEAPQEPTRAPARSRKRASRSPRLQEPSSALVTVGVESVAVADDAIL